MSLSIPPLKLLPEDFAKTMALAAEAGRALEAMPNGPAPRNRLPHPNEIIIAGSVGDCDFLVTRNTVLKGLVAGAKPQVVTPNELVARLRAA